MTRTKNIARRADRRAHDPETLANRRQILQREARLRTFGYDSPAAIRFVLAAALPLGGKVLEIGTGKGRFLIRLARHAKAAARNHERGGDGSSPELAQPLFTKAWGRGRPRPCQEPSWIRAAKTVTSVDVSAEEQRCARLNARYAGVEKRIRFVLRDAGRLPWTAGAFDAAVSMNAMHHIAHFKRVLGEMVRVVRPGGKIVLADFSPRGFQIIARAHRADGKTHPRELHDFRELGRWLRQQGLATRLCKGCNQEVLVARLPVCAR